jgi:hypothetical protein
LTLIAYTGSTVNPVVVSQVSPTGGGAVSINRTVTVSQNIFVCSAYNNSGYTFAFWQVNSIPVSGSSVIISPTASSTVTAVFSYTPPVSRYPLAASVSPDASYGFVSPSSGTYDNGTSVTLYATPTSGNVFYRWVVIGQGTYTGSTLTLTMNSTKNVVAEFTPAPVPPTAMYPLMTRISPNASYGIVSPSSGTFAENTSVSLYAVPASGNVFSRWVVIGQGSYTGSMLTLTMNSTKNVVAEFQ